MSDAGPSSAAELSIASSSWKPEWGPESGYEPPAASGFFCDVVGCKRKDKPFVSLVLLNRHKRNVHNLCTLFCHIPGCEIADQGFSSRESLKDHVASHGSKPFKCHVDGCDAKFAGSGALAQHKLTHTGERPHSCHFEGCDASFAQKYALVVHMRSFHTDERPFACEFEGCDASFSTSGGLTSHKRTHTGERPFPCDFDGCDKSFTQSNALARHKRTHTGDKPFECDAPECSAKFVSSGDLAKHKRTHTGERPFVCGFEGCGASFAQRSNLIVHKRTHTGERPFVCGFEGCDASFSQLAHLNDHKRRHRGERPHHCDALECGAKFVRSSQLAAHKEAWHSKAGIQRKKKQEEAFKNALVLGGYTESFTKGVCPRPGEFLREVYFDHRCALARDFMPGERKYAYVDFVVRTPDGRLVFVEIDEEQHAHISQLCETTRMWNICESIALADLGDGINVFWLRINPNVGFKVGAAKIRTQVSTREKRFAEVLKFLDNLKASENDPPMQVGYAFYDCHPNGKPLVMDEDDFHPDVKPAVVCISKGSHKLIQPCAFPKIDPLFATTTSSIFAAAAFGEPSSSDVAGSSEQPFDDQFDSDDD